MQRSLALFLSISLTVLSAFSQGNGKINLYGAEEATEDVTEVPVIDARGLSDSMRDRAIENAVAQAAKEPSLAVRTRMQLAENGSSAKVKKFLIIEDSNSNQDYTATLMAANIISNSYASAGIDKKKHAQWGYGIGLTSTVIFNRALKNNFDPKVANFLSRALGVLSACLVGTGKELIYDKGRANSVVDKHDAYATCAGGAAMTIGQVKFSF